MGRQFPLSRATGSELLRLVLAERGEGAANLAKLLGVDVSLAYRPLREERRLTATQIRKVADASASIRCRYCPEWPATLSP
jgi:hypothetical protein